MSGLSDMATATYSTKRSPAKVSGKTGEPVTNLEGVKFTTIMPLTPGDTTVNRPVQSANKAVSGRVKQFWIAAAESQEHTDSSVTVDQVPDIIERDKLVANGKSYTVRDAQHWPATSSTLAYIYLLIEESR